MINKGIGISVFQNRSFEAGIVKQDNLDGKKIISLVCSDRPQYFKQSIEALLKCEGIEKYGLIVNQDMQNSEMDSLIEKIDIPLVWYKNRSMHSSTIPSLMDDGFGCAGNVFSAVYRGFEVFNKEEMIILEDDVVPSPDFLKYFEFCFPIAKKEKEFFTISSYIRSLDDKRIEDVASQQWFFSWGWGVWREIWDEIKWDWDFGYEHGGWDQNLNHRLRKDRWTISPWVSRSQNIGEMGVHVPSPEWHHENQWVPVVSSGQYTSYKYIGHREI